MRIPATLTLGAGVPGAAKNMWGTKCVGFITDRKKDGSKVKFLYRQTHKWVPASAVSEEVVQ